VTWDAEYKPKLRNVEPIHLSIQGRSLIGLKDPLQLTDRMVCLEQHALPFVALMDGRHSLRDMQAELTRHAGRIVFQDEITAIVQALNDAFLLEGDTFRSAYGRKVAEYRQLPFRPASHAGMSYNADPGLLREELDAFFVNDGGPGRPAYGSDSRRAVGLIAPHIDIRSGGPCFAQGYHALAEAQPSDIYIILGTGHAGVKAGFTATGLDFQTPLGTVRTDRDFIDALSARLGKDAAAEEILHAGEHVIEFQAVFLQHMFGERHPFKVVPVLCSLPHFLFSGDPAVGELRREFEAFCEALRETVREASGTVCFIASADLDHIGPRYGDQFAPHQGTVTETLENDGHLLDMLERIDIDGFVQKVAPENDTRRICGFSPIVTMFHCMEASQGKLLALDYAQVDDRNSFVSFASMIFH
jgi:AmmeMemoRadiSam system protein B